MSDTPISRKYDLRLNLRHAGRIFGSRSITGDPDLDARGAPADGRGALVLTDDGPLSGPSGRSISTEDATPYAANRDPWKVRIPRVGRSRWERLLKTAAAKRAMIGQLRDSELPLRVRFDILKAGRPLTPQERQEVDTEVRDRRLKDHHIAQAHLGEQRIINTLDRLKHCAYSEKEGQRRIKSSVRIGYVEVNPLYYRYFVDAAALPWGVSIMDIQGDAVCTDLSASCQHPVRSEIKQVGNMVIGLYYTIEIAATMGVPNLCKFSELLPLLPTSAPPLAFITGYAEGKRFSYADLEDMPHFLGGGQTKGGKSNMMHVIICSLISRNTPDDLRLLMIDLKFNGIEMDRYRDIPHLIRYHQLAGKGEYVLAAPTGIATMPDQAVAVLQWVVNEADKRGRMFTKEGVQNLRQWNHRHPSRRLPYIVIINDELAQLRLDKKHGRESYDLLQSLLSTARAAGISFVTFTQSSNSQIIDEFIKINLPGRICFSTPDAASSILFVGTGAAMGLMPAGRAVYKHGTQQYLVQVPLIEPKDMAEVIQNAKQGKLTGHLTSRPVLPEELIEWAIIYNQSSLAWRDAFAKFGGELRRIDKAGLLALLTEMEGKDYRVGDHIYQVLPGVGNRPRILVRLDKPGTTLDPDAPESRNGTQNTGATQGQHCPYCGVTLDPLDPLCPACGAPIEEG